MTEPLYRTKAWGLIREAALARDGYLCQPCLRRDRLTPANTVHHVEPIETTPERALDLSNLESCCSRCHNRAHPEKPSRWAKRKRQERPEPQEPKRKARVITT